MLRISTGIVCTAILLALPVSSAAFDGERKGFFLGVGLGGGSVSATQDWTLFDEEFSQDDSGGGAAVNFRLGYGLSNQLILSLSANSGSGTADDINARIFDIANEEGTSAFAVRGIGITYFLKDAGPSLFVDATLGQAVWDDGINGSMGGGGVSLGAGYEFKKNWTVEADLSLGSPSDETSVFGESIKAEVSGTAIGVSVGHIWY